MKPTFARILGVILKTYIDQEGGGSSCWLISIPIMPMENTIAYLKNSSRRSSSDEVKEETLLIL